MSELINYVPQEKIDECRQYALRKENSSQFYKSYNRFNIDFRIFETDGWDDNIMRQYYNRTLPLHNGIMETTYDAFYKLDEITRMEYVLTRTFIVDELCIMYKYPEQYKIEFLINFEAELGLLIDHVDFCKLTEFTKELFKTLRNYAISSLEMIKISESNHTIEYVIKKVHGIK